MQIIHASFKKVKAKKKPGWQQREAEYAAWLAKHGIDPKAKRKETFESLKREPEPYRRETKHYPSLGMGVGVAVKVEPQRYTGTLIKGIATMHKSNAVPIIDDQHAKDIAHMRR